MLNHLDFIIGPISTVKADVLINSANGALIHKTGTAADISLATGRLNSEEVNEFKKIVEKMPGIVGSVYRRNWIEKNSGPVLTRLQLFSAKLLVKRKGLPLDRGECVQMDSGELEKKGVRQIINVIAMTYDFGRTIQPSRDRRIIFTTPKIVSDVIEKSLIMIKKQGFSLSVAIPILCTRKGGLTPEQSLEAIKEGISRVEDMKMISKIIIVADNTETAKFLQENNFVKKVY